ncbi:hypothetical protein GF323_04655 [Candidatus Woesearchaeota archaeon]|nr:hypothetical protein [Candidatus Woesearchaeota archaeon]
MRINKWLNKQQLYKKFHRITVLFSLSLIFLFFAFKFAEKILWWDSAVYIAIGKYIFSLGKYGLWEPARPVLWPIILGFFWRAGFNPVIIGRALSLLVSASSIILLYFMIRHFVDNSSAFIFSLLFALNIVLIKFSTKILVDIPAMLFSMLAAYIFIKRQNAFYSGIFVGLAIMAKFTHLSFIPVFIIAILFMKNEYLKKISYFLVGTAVVILPFLIFNLILYKNPIYSFLEAKYLIDAVVLNYNSPQTWYYYIANILMSAPLLILAVFSSYKIITWKKALLISAFIIPLLYHSFLLNYKNIRYSVIFLPYLYTLAALGFGFLRNKQKWIKYLIYLLLAAQIIFSFNNVLAFRQDKNPDIYLGFYSFDIPNTAEIWSTTPNIAAQKDLRIGELMYYPVFDNKKIAHLKNNLHKPDYIFLNTCDIPCVNYDLDCEQSKAALLEEISQNFKTAFYESKYGCNLSIYEK